MRAVKSRDTGPEIAVRAMLRAIAPGYRLCRADLPGKPDIVYGRRKLAIFVHGCFWHGHDCPRGARMPKTNADYWRAKIARNRARDARGDGGADGDGLAGADRLRMRAEGSGGFARASRRRICLRIWRPSGSVGGTSCPPFGRRPESRPSGWPQACRALGAALRKPLAPRFDALHK